MLKTLFALASCHKIIVLLAIVGLAIWFWRMYKKADKVIGNENYSPSKQIRCFVKVMLLEGVIVFLIVHFVVYLL
jgi:sterol desaturase/sphingolipid hydroxylase (fatty acid hydroxylase superfamily)